MKLKSLLDALAQVDDVMDIPRQAPRQTTLLQVGNLYCAWCVTTITVDLDVFEANICAQSPSNLTFSEGVHYLEFYYHCAVQNISNRFDNGFWVRTALQMAQSEPSIRHGLIALGYLNKTKPASLRSLQQQTNESERVFHLHYSKAITHMVERMAQPSYAIELGLATCLVFICIEFLRGNALT